MSQSHHPLRCITVHCSATTPSQQIGVADIRQWHQAKGWRDVGYHYVITRQGHVEQGRALNQVGAHVRGHNHGNIGICLVGGCDTRQQPQDNFTLAQRKALFGLITRLQAVFSIADDQVQPHHHWANKACPVMVIQPLLSNLTTKEKA
ncbi:N-acetylmuramoyl-L-alanine amidase [Vibrio aestuarianus]|uniref:N-acetylmuramoyl-L-alanine amidase n=1 Tax=Vibrio aestuarianus TaxID=28171 RepID=UPI00237CA8E9|nr:N-acetylmuramoyl-L-alanine amidase [Vibrio aestuarianus]MDE1333414.1 N-acetylmuramoyl-L-alanine amidase [Vibrio aestuarianus]